MGHAFPSHDHGRRSYDQRSTRWSPGFVLALLAIVHCGGVGGCNREASSGTPRPSKVLRVGVQKSGLLSLVRWRGRLADKLSPLGWRLEWIEFPAGPQLLEAMNVGSIDFGHTGDSPPIFAQSAGVPFRYVAASDPCPQGSGILVPNTSSLRKLEDLKGKKVAFTKGSSAHHMVLAALESVGLSLSDIKPIYLLASDARAALVNGSVDAWAIWDPYFAIAERTDGVRLLVDGKGLVSGREFFIASESFYSTQKELLSILVDDLNDVGKWATDHPREVAEYLSPLMGIDVDTLEYAERRRARHNANPLSEALVREQQQLASRYRAAGLILVDIDVRKTFPDNLDSIASKPREAP